MIITWPFLFLLLDFWPFNRFGFLSTAEGKNNLTFSQDKHRLSPITEKIPVFMIIAVFSWIAFTAQHSEGAVVSTQEFPVWMRFENAAISYVQYIKDIFFPVSLAALYPLTFTSATLWKFIACLILILCITLAALKFRHKKPYFLVGWFWFLGTLVPVIGLTQISVQARADRYTYLPCLGILLIVCKLGGELAARCRLNKTLLALAIAVMGTYFMISSWIYTMYWQNGLTLFQHTVAVTENNYLALLSYGYGLEHDGQYAESIKQYEQSLALCPESPDPWMSLGRVYLKEKQYEQAKKYLQKANELTDSKEPVILELLAQTCLALNEPDTAKRYIQKGIDSVTSEQQKDVLNRLKKLQEEVQPGRRD